MPKGELKRSYEITKCFDLLSDTVLGYPGDLFNSMAELLEEIIRFTAIREDKYILNTMFNHDRIISAYEMQHPQFADLRWSKRKLVKAY